MSVWLVGAIALLTYGSRALALVVMPDPSPRVKQILDRVPAPLFAALAAMSLFEGGKVADERTLAAAVGALLLTPTRSMFWVLTGGLGGFGLADLLL